jgi:hypothetical protein
MFLGWGCDLFVTVRVATLLNQFFWINKVDLKLILVVNHNLGNVSFEMI